MAKMSKSLRSQIVKLDPEARAAVHHARRNGYIAFVDAAGNIGLKPRQVGSKKGRRACYNKGRRVDCR